MTESEIREELKTAKAALEEMTAENSGSRADRAALVRFISELSAELSEIIRQRKHYGAVLN